MADLKPSSVIKLLESVLNWLCLYISLALMWIGAEYAFEGAVHSSHVDSVVNALLAYYILRYEPKGGTGRGDTD